MAELTTLGNESTYRKFPDFFVYTRLYYSSDVTYAFYDFFLTENFLTFLFTLDFIVHVTKFMSFMIFFLQWPYFRHCIHGIHVKNILHFSEGRKSVLGRILLTTELFFTTRYGTSTPFHNHSQGPSDTFLQVLEILWCEPNKHRSGTFRFNAKNQVPCQGFL